MKWLRRALRGATLSRPTDAEIGVLGLVLQGDDPRLRQVRDQLVRAPAIEREYPTPDTFRVGPTSTFDDLSFALEVERLESDWIQVAEADSGRLLEFRVVLGRHGFLRGLEGRTVDGGPWPREWSVDVLRGPTTGPAIKLPLQEDTARFEERARLRLSEWLGVDVPADVEVWPPLSGPAVAARQQSLGGPFPEDYLSFLSSSDGLTSGGVQILGANDAYPIENPFISALVIAWDADDREDFVVALALGGREETVFRINVSDPDARPLPIAKRFSEYVRALLAR